jgi:hypothetical protein
MLHLFVKLIFALLAIARQLAYFDGYEPVRKNISAFVDLAR